MPSHAIHGTWVDLLTQHLEQTETGFRLKNDFSRIDSRLLFPQSMAVLQAASEYLTGFVSTRLGDLEQLFQRIDNLADRIETVSHAYEVWIQTQRESWSDSWAYGAMRLPSNNPLEPTP